MIPKPLTPVCPLLSRHLKGSDGIDSKRSAFPDTLSGKVGRFFFENAQPCHRQSAVLVMLVIQRKNTGFSRRMFLFLVEDFLFEYLLIQFSGILKSLIRIQDSSNFRGKFIECCKYEIQVIFRKKVMRCYLIDK